jgi:hypothetical protein
MLRHNNGIKREHMKEFDESNARDRVESSPSSSAAGAGATSPAQIPPKGWWNALRHTAAGFADDRVMTEAAGVTCFPRSPRLFPFMVY